MNEAAQSPIFATATPVTNENASGNAMNPTFPEYDPESDGVAMTATDTAKPADGATKVITFNQIGQNSRKYKANALYSHKFGFTLSFENNYQNDSFPYVSDLDSRGEAERLGVELGDILVKVDHARDRDYRMSPNYEINDKMGHLESAAFPVTLHFNPIFQNKVVTFPVDYFSELNRESLWSQLGCQFDTVTIPGAQGLFTFIGKVKVNGHAQRLGVIKGDTLVKVNGQLVVGKNNDEVKDLIGSLRTDITMELNGQVRVKKMSMQQVNRIIVGFVLIFALCVGLPLGLNAAGHETCGHHNITCETASGRSSSGASAGGGCFVEGTQVVIQMARNNGNQSNYEIESMAIDSIKPGMHVLGGGRVEATIQVLVNWSDVFTVGAAEDAVHVSGSHALLDPVDGVWKRVEDAIGAARRLGPGETTLYNLITEKHRIFVLPGLKQGKSQDGIERTVGVPPRSILETADYLEVDDSDEMLEGNLKTLNNQHHEL